MLDHVLPQLGLEVQFDLNLARPPGQDLNEMTAAVLSGVDGLLAELRPHRVMVHGTPPRRWPRRWPPPIAASRSPMSKPACAPTIRPVPGPRRSTGGPSTATATCCSPQRRGARANLLAENLPGRIVLTGNTGIDSLLASAGRLERDPDLRARIDRELPTFSEGKRLILVTGHRRETLGAGLLSVCQALSRLSERDDVEILYALHLNPAVEGPVRGALGERPNIHLAPPAKLSRLHPADAAGAPDRHRFRRRAGGGAGARQAGPW